MIYRKLLAIFAFCLMIGNVIAAESDWRFSIGANYRTFDDIDFEQLRFINPKYPSSQFVNGTYAADTLVVEDGAVQAPGLFQADQTNVPKVFIDFSPLNGLVDIPAEVSAADIPIRVTYDSITFMGADKEFDEGSGVVFGARRVLKEKSGYSWELDLSFATALSDTDEDFNPETTTLSTNVTGTVFLRNVNEDGDGEVTAGNFPAPISLGAAANVTGRVEYDLDLAAYTFGAGVSGNFKAGNFGFIIGAGPTLTIADLDVDAVQRANFTKKLKDDATDLLFGVYVNAGLNYNLNESVAVGLEYRFDYVFDDVSTNLADVDLSGSSTQAKLIFGF